MSIVAAVTKDLTAKMHAGKLVGAWRRPWAAGAVGSPTSAKRAARILRAADALARNARKVEAMRDVRRSNCRRRAHGPGVRHRAQEARPPADVIDKGCVINSLYNYPTQMDVFTTPELLEIGKIPMTSIERKAGADGGAQILPARR